METTVDLNSFNPSHVTSLIFSIFECLKEGESFLILTSENPTEIQKQFIEASVGDFKWEARKKMLGSWEAKITKIPPETKHGSHCCGMCSS